MAEKKALPLIQAELKVPKTRYNKFGEFHYRSCDDILEAVKPLLEKTGATLVMSDSIELIGDRHYVKSEAKIFTDGEYTTSYGYAREPLTKKKMDDAQVTSMSSSYARKVALCGLFALDDGRDADAEKPENKPKDKFQEILDKAFEEMGKKHQTYLEAHPQTKMDMDKFIKAIHKKYGKLPSRVESIPKIIKEIKLSDILADEFDAHMAKDENGDAPGKSDS